MPDTVRAWGDFTEIKNGRGAPRMSIPTKYFEGGVKEGDHVLVYDGEGNQVFAKVQEFEGKLGETLTALVELDMQTWVSAY